MIDEQDIVQRADSDLLTTDLGDEQVILDARRGEYFGLNPVGTFLFGSLSEPTPVADLVDAVVERYEIERASALADVRSFLEEMRRLGLVDVRQPT
jgi:hypothetical protein